MEVTLLGLKLDRRHRLETLALHNDFFYALVNIVVLHQGEKIYIYHIFADSVVVAISDPFT